MRYSEEVMSVKSRLAPWLPPAVLTDFCKRWKIATLELFGSALTGDFHADSDLDLLVTFRPEADWSLFDHVRMKQELEDLTGRKVDLMTRRAVERSHNPLLRREILSSAQVVYAATETPAG
jgi:uncharacterized protein